MSSATSHGALSRIATALCPGEGRLGFIYGQPPAGHGAGLNVDWPTFQLEYIDASSPFGISLLQWLPQDAGKDSLLDFSSNILKSARSYFW